MFSLPKSTFKLALSLSVLSTLFATSTLAYLVLFCIDYMDLHAPIGVNHTPAWNRLPRLVDYPLINNVLVILLLNVQHSGMRRGPIKKLTSFFVSETYYRSFYVLTAGLCMLSLYFFWVPMPTILWDITNPVLWYVIVSFDLFAWGMVPIAVLNLGMFQMFGISDHLSKTNDYQPTLSTKGLFALMRHPSYAFLMMAMWSTPKMTIGHCLLSSMYTLYIMIAVAVYEEPALVKEFGPAYVEYMNKTPRFVPSISSVMRIGFSNKVD